MEGQLGETLPADDNEAQDLTKECAGGADDSVDISKPKEKKVIIIDPSDDEEEEELEEYDSGDGDYKPTVFAYGSVVSDQEIRRSRRKSTPKRICYPGEASEPVSAAKRPRPAPPDQQVDAGSTNYADTSVGSPKKNRYLKAKKKKETIVLEMIDFECQFCHEHIGSDQILSHVPEKHADAPDEERETYLQEIKDFLSNTLTSEPKRRPKNIGCPLCNSMFTMHLKVAEHVKKTHDVNDEATKKVLEDLKDKCHVICGLCGLKLREDGIQQHMKLVHVHSNTTFECGTCHNEFKREDLLALHIKRVHAPTERHLCHLCPKHFKNKIYLKEHVESAHVGKKTFECKHCHHILTSPRILSKHTKSIHGNVQFKCSHCTAVFNTNANMKRHVKLIHFPNDVKRIPCSEADCSKTFTSAANMKQHLAACHIAEFGYECTKCDKRFNKKKQYDEHKLIHQVMKGKPQSIMLTAHTSQEPMFLHIERMPAGMQVASNDGSKPVQIMNTGVTQIFEQSGPAMFVQSQQGQGSTLPQGSETVVIKATNSAGQPIKLNFYQGDDGSGAKVYPLPDTVTEEKPEHQQQAAEETQTAYVDQTPGFMSQLASIIEQASSGAYSGQEAFETNEGVTVQIESAPDGTQHLILGQMPPQIAHQVECALSEPENKQVAPPEPKSAIKQQLESLAPMVISPIQLTVENGGEDHTPTIDASASGINTVVIQGDATKETGDGETPKQ